MSFIYSSTRLPAQRCLKYIPCPLQRDFSSSAPRASASTLSSSTPLAPPRPVAFAFDIDGVLKRGARVVPGAIKALDYLHGNNKYGLQIPYILLTNGGGIPEKDRAGILSQTFDTQIKPEQVLQAHSVFASLASKHGNDPVLVVGGPDFALNKVRAAMHSYGFKDPQLVHDLLGTDSSAWPFSQLDENQRRRLRRDNRLPHLRFKAVIVFHDSRDWGRDFQIMLDVLTGKDNVWKSQEQKSVLQQKKQIPVYFSHGDLLYENDFPVPRLGLGAFKEAFKAVYKAVTGLDLEYTVFGKPTKLTYDYAETLIQQQISANHADASAAVEGTKEAIEGLASPTTGAQDSAEAPTTSPGPDEAVTGTSSTSASARPAVYMIGDNPESDIRGGNDHGWNTCLVQTGVYKLEQGEPAYAPTMLVKDVEEAVRTSLEREWGPGAVVDTFAEKPSLADPVTAGSSDVQQPPAPLTEVNG